MLTRPTQSFGRVPLAPALVSLILLAVPALASAQALFQCSFRTFSTGADPVALAAGDFNKDGHLDIVTADHDASAISILLGRGDGTYPVHTDYGAGAGTCGVVVADFNHDGHLDIATSNSSGNSISVFLGNGDGTFAPRVEYATGAQPTSVCCGDVNSDGILDLITTNASGSLSEFFGVGDGTFGPRTDMSLGFNAGQAVLADINLDGRLDLVLGSVMIMLGNGDGTFQTGTSYTNPSSGPAMVGDLNGDGIPDVAVPNFSSISVTVFLGVGDGTLRPGISYPAPYQPTAVAIADLAGNGRHDLVVAANGLPTCVSVRMQDTTGVLGSQGQFTLPGQPKALIVGDIDGDGRPDLVAVLPYIGICTMTGNGDGTFGSARTIPAGANTDFVSGDLNGDGRLDLVLAGTSSLSILLQNSDGSFSPGPSISMGQDISTPTLADFDRDGHLDMAVITGVGFGAGGSDSAVVLLGNGDGTFRRQRGVFVPSPHGAFAIAAGDFNRDGIPDLVVANAGVSVLLGSGGGHFAPPVAYTGYDARTVYVGDLNGDGAPDFVVNDENGNGVIVYLNRGDGTFTGPSTYYPDPGLIPLALRIGYLRAGGYPDIVAIGEGTEGAEVAVLLNDHTGHFPTHRLTSLGIGFSPSAIALGDLDLDGFVDIAALAPANSVILLMGAGDGTFTLGAEFGAEGSPNAVLVGDFNLDQRPDIAVLGGSVTLMLHEPTPLPLAVAPAGRPRFALESTYPNPASERVAIAFALPAAGLVQLDVYDLSGRLVHRLANGTMQAGEHYLHWDVTGANGLRARPGVYFLALKFAGQLAQRRVAILK